MKQVKSFFGMAFSTLLYLLLPDILRSSQPTVMKPKFRYGRINEHTRTHTKNTL
jgi:hypothetical protein